MTPQSGICPDTSVHAYFIRLNIRLDADLAILKNALRAIPRLTEQKNLQFPDARPLSVISFSASACQKLFDDKPAELTHFPVIADSVYPLPDTQTDLLLHVRADIFHVCFTLTDQIVQSLQPCCEAVETRHAFLRHQKRDFTGFIDGTENPEPEDRPASALVAQGEWAGGSFVHNQRYLHDLGRWNKLKVSEQEGIIGRTKPDDIELDDEMKPPTAHISRVVIEEHGEELDIMRQSLPYGEPGAEHGLVFITYSHSPDIFTRMLTHMASPAQDGHVDALLKFTTAQTGGAYFAPSVEKLAQL